MKKAPQRRASAHQRRGSGGVRAGASSVVSEPFLRMPVTSRIVLKRRLVQGIRRHTKHRSARRARREKASTGRRDAPRDADKPRPAPAPAHVGNGRTPQNAPRGGARTVPIFPALERELIDVRERELASAQLTGIRSPSGRATARARSARRIATRREPGCSSTDLAPPSSSSTTRPRGPLPPRCHRSRSRRRRAGGVDGNPCKW
jgi:hypothetical protein